MKLEDKKERVAKMRSRLMLMCIDENMAMRTIRIKGELIELDLGLWAAVNNKPETLVIPEFVDSINYHDAMPWEV